MCLPEISSQLHAHALLALHLKVPDAYAKNKYY